MEGAVDGVVLAVGFELEAPRLGQAYQGDFLFDAGHCFVR
jgi:hypothetical protein